jgi:AraC-like DNA-binding protein
MMEGQSLGVPEDAVADHHVAEQGSWKPTAKGAMARLAYAKAKAAGVALEPLLIRAHLTRDQIENPRARIKVRSQIEFLNLVSDALDDEFLGFHLAQIPDLREMGWVYYVLASSELLIDAFRRAERYSSMINEGISAKCIDGANVGSSLHYVGVGRHLDRHQIEFWMTVIVRICRQLTGLRLFPNQVRLMHLRERRPAEFAAFFGDNIQFGAGVDEITFDKKVRDLPIVNADPYLNKLLVAYCEEVVRRQRTGRGSFRTRVENVIVPLLPHGEARADQIARRLGVSQRTFARRLSSEGLTFQGLMETLRYSLANRYLADKEISISQIAWLLGYQEVGAFSHAFKRWSGEAPREVRARVTLSGDRRGETGGERDWFFS